MIFCCNFRQGNLSSITFHKETLSAAAGALPKRPRRLPWAGEFQPFGLCGNSEGVLFIKHGASLRAPVICQFSHCLGKLMGDKGRGSNLWRRKQVPCCWRAGRNWAVIACSCRKKSRGWCFIAEACV